LLSSRRVASGAAHLERRVLLGEEAYSLAILLASGPARFGELARDLLATDINGRFLRKAVTGSLW